LLNLTKPLSFVLKPYLGPISPAIILGNTSNVFVSLIGTIKV
jgi:hypothetical protein